MGRDTIQLEDAVSTISQEYLLEFSSEYYIPENLHPELPGPGDHIVDFPEGKVGVYTKKIEFANFRIPNISKFLFDILGYYQIHLSQLSVIGAAKVSHFEINCRVLNIIPTVNLFRVFYVSSYNSGWMSFSKRPGKNTPQCYTKPLDSLKNWNNRFFWVDEKVFPTVVAWRMAATKDDKPKANTYSVVDVATLDTHRTPIQKQPEELLCLVGLSRNFFLRDDEYPIFLNDNDQEMDLFNLIKAPNPTKVKTGTRQRTAHEVPLLTATASRVIQMVDATELSTSSGTPSTVERSPLDFSNEDAPPPAAVEPDLEKEVISMGPTIKKRRRQRDAGEGGSNAPAKVLRKDHDAARAEHITRVGKSLADMSVDTELVIHVHETQEPPVATQSVSDPDPLSYSKPQPNPKRDVAQSSKEEGVAGNQDSEKSTPSPSITGSPGSIYQPGWGVPNSCRLDTPEACQDMVDHIAPPGLSAEVEIRAGGQTIEEICGLAEINMKKSAEAKNSEVTKKLKDLRMRFSGLEVGNAQLSQQVNARCAEIDARLDALIVDFNEELYPHMLTAIVVHRWVIGHGLRLAVMKCAESTKLRQAFANVVSAGIARGMSEGLKYGVEHGKAGLELTDVEAYDPEADSKYVAALHDLKDLNYPLIDELEQLKDAPLDVIMASLYLDTDTGEDAPQFIRDLRPSSSQLKIPVYPEVRDPRNLWACKEEILMEDAITANISHAEKKKKNRVVCRTHGVGSTYHARSDGIPVSVPTVDPQGLQILIADAATQTEDKESPWLLRSKSLPPMFNLVWP
ncbi:hypothetical protein Tco_0644452 [Tanacetum coccineum]